MTELAERPAPRRTSSDSGSTRWVLEPEPGEVLAPREEGPALGVEYPDMPTRGIAFVLDLLLIQSTGTVLLQPAAFLSGAVILRQQGITDRVIGSWIGFALPVLVVAVLQALVLAGFWRVYTASPGQLLTGLQTVRLRDGRRLSRRAGLVRWLLLFMPALMLTASTDLGIWWAFGVGKASDQNGASGIAITLPVIWYAVLLVSALVDGRGRGLHDRLSRSVVVRRVSS